MGEQIERTERLLNLVICLMATPQAVPRSVVRDQIPGYGQAASESAFERMFERDKDELRSMGIPIETVTDHSGEVRGYRIRRDDYALDGIELTLQERSAVAVAAQVWGQAVVAPLAGNALRKLQSIESQGWAPADLRGEVVLTASDAALLPLLNAVRLDRVVTFDYRTPAAEAASTRTVSPWGLRSSQGAWFLVGYDHDREAPRTFRLSRVNGAVTVTGRSRPHPAPPGFDVRADPGLDASEVSVRVRAKAGRCASLRSRSTHDDRWTAAEVEFTAASVQHAIGLVAACGADAVALSPAEVVDGVRAALTTLSGEHAS